MFHCYSTWVIDILGLLRLLYGIQYFIVCHCYHTGVFQKFSVLLYRGRKPMTPEQRLVITLRFLATGAPYRSNMQWEFCVAHNTLSIMVREVCDAIADEYKGELVKLPRTEAGWREVADGFSQRWNFEHCLGAIDGKHIAIKKPKSSGSENYNYKKFCSIVLLAMVDSEYKFMWADVGSPGSCSDGGIWKESKLYKRIERGRQGIPAPEPLPGHHTPLPWFFVGDAAFALAPWMQKPFPYQGLNRRQRIYNYRLSRARRIIENAFGILVMHWRCLTTTMGLAPENASKVVIACLNLHNLIRLRRGPPNAGEVDQADNDNAAWRREPHLRDNDNNEGARPPSKARMYREAQAAREYLADYYSTPQGAVPWQDRIGPIRREETESESSSDSDSEVD